MQLTFRVIARINNIIKFKKLSRTQSPLFLTQNFQKFTLNTQNNQFLHNVFALSRLLEIHQGCIFQHIFQHYTHIHNLYIPQEPMLDYLRVDSQALPFADNIAQKILDTIITQFIQTLPASTDMNFYIQTFNILDTTPFIFFYHSYFDNIDIGTGKLKDLPTFCN